MPRETRRAPPSAEAPSSTFLGSFLRKELAGSFALGCVQPAIAVFVELFHQFGFFPHAAKTAGAAPEPTRTKWRGTIEARSFIGRSAWLLCESGQQKRAGNNRNQRLLLELTNVHSKRRFIPNTV